MKEKYENLLIVYSNKKDGNMAVKYGETADYNRQKFIQKMELPLNRFLFMQALNGDKIVQLKEDVLYGNLYYKLIEADAIVCSYNNVYLYLNFADCIPLTVYDKKQNIFAFAHLGWRSTYLNLHQKLFHLFVEEYHSDISDLLIHIGPCIKKESYIFENPEQKEMEAWKHYVSNVKDDYYSIDLSGYVTDYFLQTGIPEKQIILSNIDTCQDNRFFSHYRSAKLGEKEGRFFYAVGMLKKEE